MEAVAMEPRRESSMRKMRTRETAAAETRASAHAADMHAADVHAAGTHPSPHPAVHTASHAATVTTASKHRWGKGKRRSKRTRDKATKELVVHPNSSVVEF